MGSETLKGKHIAVWFSCGAASAVAAKLTLEKYGASNKVSVVNNPVKEEHEDNRRFLSDVAAWLGVEIQSSTNYKYPSASCKDVWDDRAFMSGVSGAPCTQELKKQSRQYWENFHKPDYTVLGFTYDEVARAERFKLTERDTLLTPLIEQKLTKQDCFDIISGAGIALPAIYSLGYPNANCIGCVKATSPTYWNLVRNTFPEVFEDRAKQSRRLGAKLVRHKGKRIFLDELPPDAVGRPLKNYHIECGIFCEESDG